MLLPLLVIGPFFVLGLKFRAALIAVALTLVAYFAATMALGLALPLLVRSCVLLTFLAAACAVVARQFERTARTSFLESHLIAELAERDALTGLKNRAASEAAIDRVLAESTAGGWPAAGRRR